MSNKPVEQLSDIDRRIRRLFPTTMWDGTETICTIKFYGGFELFNTRPYHNYETWSEGYLIEAGERYGNVKAGAEDLDDALTKFEEKIKEYRHEHELD